VSTKTPARISGLLTVLALVLLAVLSVLIQMLILNGVSEGQAFNAVAASLICQSVGMIPAVLLVRWLTHLTIAKFNWNAFLAVAAAVLAGVVFGVGISFLAIIVSTLMAGIR
jgi:hypothetical protein